MKMSLVRAPALIQGMVILYGYFLCVDGSVKVNLTLLAEYSQVFNEIINTIDKCKMCKVYINLPDHNIKSILKLVELLSNGETNVQVSVKYHSC